MAADKIVDVLNVRVKANLTVEEREEECDVCEAMQELADRAAREASERTEKEVAERTAKEDRIAIMRNLMNSVGWTATEAMENMKIAEGDRAELLALLEDPF